MPKTVTDAENLRLSIVVPAYNEENRIGDSLGRLLEYFDGQGYGYEILVVDDGSSDETISVVKKAAEGRANVRVLHYDGNRGKGHAVRYGILRSGGEYVLFSDADLATPIEEVEKLFPKIHEGFEVVIGSRDVSGSKLEKRQSPFREFGGKLFNKCVQMVAVPGIHDTQCGFKLFTRAAAQDIFGRCKIDNFSFDVEALYLARKLGYRIAEVGIRWHHVEGSKVRFFRDAGRMLATLLQIRFTNYGIRPAALPEKAKR